MILLLSQLNCGLVGASCCGLVYSSVFLMESMFGKSLPLEQTDVIARDCCLSTTSLYNAVGLAA